MILRSGVNDKEKKIHYVFNYSYETKRVAYPFADSKSLLDNQLLKKGAMINIEPWGVVIGEEK